MVFATKDHLQAAENFKELDHFDHVDSHQGPKHLGKPRSKPIQWEKQMASQRTFKYKKFGSILQKRVKYNPSKLP